MVTMQKWLVDVRCEGWRGLFYRSAPNVIVPDADWPRNGDIVVGHEVPHVPGEHFAVLVCCRLKMSWSKISPFGIRENVGWIRLQNGYYLPMHSDDGNIPFLHKVSTRPQPSNAEMKRIGSSTPLFRSAEQESIASLLGGTVAIAEPSTTAAKEENIRPSVEEKKDDNIRAAVHMDAMAFGMGCCCLQITFQAKDIDESRFIYDQIAVMAPM